MPLARPVAAAVALAALATAAGAASLDGTHVHGLAFDPADPDRLLVATHHGLLALEDGQLEPVSDSRDDFMGFSAHPKGDGVFFASGHPVAGGNLGVIVSRDGGRTWEPLSDGVGGPVDFHQMDVSKADPNVIVGVHGGVQASLDGGRTWTVTGRPPAPMIALALSATDPRTVYAGTEAGLFVSDDLGATWRQAGPVAAPATAVATVADGSVYVYDVANGLAVKDPGADGFRQVAPPFGDDGILHLAIRDGQMAAATWKGALLGSADGGATWEPLID